MSGVVLRRVSRCAVVLLCLAGAALTQAREVVGAGASFPSKVYERWASAYAERPDAAIVRYRATGSGDGIKQITARSVAFAGTDSPLSAAELAQRKLVQIPMVVGGVVPVVNLPGVAPHALKLTGDVLADLMTGRIALWNDPRVAALNPGLALPRLAVRRIVRAEKSGTTEGYTRYLSRVSAVFQATVGIGQLPRWGEGVTAAEGNDGVARAVKYTPGTIGYVSYDRVLRDGLTPVSLRNAAGRYVRADERAFRAAIMESDLQRLGDDTASVLDRPGSGSWPITLVTFVLVDARPQDAGPTQAALRFLYWAFMHGDELTRGTGFAPLPLSVQSRAAGRFGQVRDREGLTLRYTDL